MRFSRKNTTRDYVLGGLGFFAIFLVAIGLPNLLEEMKPADPEIDGKRYMQLGNEYNYAGCEFRIEEAMTDDVVRESEWKIIEECRNNTHRKHVIEMWEELMNRGRY